MSDRFIYFVSDGHGHVKIGVSMNPWARIASLQTGTPLPLKILHTIPGDQSDEAYLHEMFEQSRIAGEWFHFTKEMQDFVAFARRGVDDKESLVQSVFMDWVDEESFREQHAGLLYDQHEWGNSVQ